MTLLGCWGCIGLHYRGPGLGSSRAAQLCLPEQRPEKQAGKMFRRNNPRFMMPSHMPSQGEQVLEIQLWGQGFKV